MIVCGQVEEPVLHPGQIEACNEVFTPNQADFDKAVQILAAYRHATEVEGRDCVLLGGTVHDEATLDAACTRLRRFCEDLPRRGR